MKSLDQGTLGNERHSVRVPGFLVSEVWHAPDFHAEAHAHRFATMKLILGGAYAERTRGSSAVHAPSTVLTKPAEVVHTNEPFPEPTRSVLIERVGDRDESPTGTHLFDEVGEQPAGLALSSGLRLVQELRHPEDGTNRSSVEEALISFLAILVAHRGRFESRPGWLRRAIEYLEDQPRGRVDLGAIAADVGVERHYLCRAFRHATGRTLSEYARSVRLQRAMTRLTTTDDPIAMVAWSSGFYDQAHLTRCFVQATGVTPGQHRKLTRSVEPY